MTGPLVSVCCPTKLVHARPFFSLMRSLVNGRGSPTEGNPEEASTVGIELLRHRLKDTTVEFYDCAGQLDYVGMHQTFLSRRAVYLLVWDVKKCHKCDSNELTKVKVPK